MVWGLGGRKSRGYPIMCWFHYTFDLDNYPLYKCFVLGRRAIMEYQITHIYLNPDETPDLVVATKDNEKYIVAHLVQGSSAKDVKVGDKLDFDWEPYGPGVAVNAATGEDISIEVEFNNMTPDDIKDKVIPTFPL
jgi:hypothetical protein